VFEQRDQCCGETSAVLRALVAFSGVLAPHLQRTDTLRCRSVALTQEQRTEHREPNRPPRKARRSGTARNKSPATVTRCAAEPCDAESDEEQSERTASVRITRLREERRRRYS
jgi:hypothetical protein